jgi:hypothetical protein
MNFRTQIPISKTSHPIGYDSKVVSLGSCFAVNMSEKFDYFKFRNTANPFGILYHPLAIEKFIGFAINRTEFTEKDIFFHNERWHSFDAHSDLSCADKSDMLDNLNSFTEFANTQITDATHIIITLGTAWVYTDIDSGESVANCHKMPQKQFAKELLSAEAIGKSLGNIISLLKSQNPEIHIIFTVSPVRHIKDGFVENQWSKSNLISASHQILQDQPVADYFPSYEIMMDELRDYRFYAEDMLHPNQVAIDYIWERFSQTCISAEALSVMEEIGNIQKGLAHKSFNPDSVQHRDFLQKLQGRIAELQSRHNHIAF